jgi:hypothetical protein
MAGRHKPRRQPTRKEYLRWHINRVPGYLRDPDPKVIATLLAWQEQIGVSGNLCEIGVHHGRLFLLLALSRQADEKALAIDLFEDDNINVGPQVGRNSGLLRQASRLGIELSTSEILKVSSLELTPAEILNRTGGLIRFFSVDGGHMYHHVRNDLELACACLAEDGVIAADDFFFLKWPEVSFAVFDFLRDTPQIVPVFATNRKLYLARRGFAPRLLDFILQSPPRGVSVEFPTEIMGNNIALLRISLFARARQELRARWMR